MKSLINKKKPTSNKGKGSMVIQLTFKNSVFNMYWN